MLSELKNRGVGDVLMMAALKCVYLAIMDLDPTGQGRRRWMIRGKPALNASAIAFDGRINPSSS